MRFKNGSKVEVMNKEVPASWCVAEIISGNGDAYNVKYDGYQGVQKVSRRFIRPSPAKRSLKIGSQICEEEDDCLPIYNDVRLHNSHVVSRNRKRASPFCSSLHEPCHIAKKVKPAEKDGSQRYVSGHASKKSYKIGGMHLLLPKIQTRFWFCCLSVGKSSGTLCSIHLLLQIR